MEDEEEPGPRCESEGGVATSEPTISSMGAAGTDPQRPTSESSDQACCDFEKDAEMVVVAAESPSSEASEQQSFQLPGEISPHTVMTPAELLLHLQIQSDVRRGKNEVTLLESPDQFDQGLEKRVRETKIVRTVGIIFAFYVEQTDV